MKVVYIGAGAVRTLAETRELLALPAIREGGTIVLHDINPDRLAQIHAVLAQVPELRGANVTLATTADLDEALDGADFVQLTARPWPADLFARGNVVSAAHGLASSDNLTPTAAFLATHSVPLAVDVARRMERLCPQATLIVFTNPIAVLTGAVRRATKIRSIGICAGQANHMYDLSRWMGWDPPRFDFRAQCAGLNHLSWIYELTLDGEDFFPVLDRRIEEGIDFDNLPGSFRNRQAVAQMYRRMIEVYRDFGLLLFSSEGDGLPHLCYYDCAFAPRPTDAAKAARSAPPTTAPDDFVQAASRTLDDAFWSDPAGPAWRKLPHPNTATGVRVISGLSGSAATDVAASLPNRGAIEDLPDDAVVECTWHLDGDRITHPRAYRLHPVAAGVTRGIADCQSLLAQAIVAQDPRRFREALYAYPLGRSRQLVDGFLAEMRRTCADVIPAWMR